jgi:iron(III) transport system substrate-binding protein
MWKGEEEMKKWPIFKKMSFVMVLACIFTVSSSIARAETQMTPLEKNLYEAAKKEGKLIYWDSQSLKDTAKFTKAFNARYPGIEIVYYEANAVDSDQKYFMERKAGKHLVDVTHIDWYLKYRKEAYLADLTDIVKDTNFPLSCVSPNFDAAGLHHTVKAVAYNTNLVSEKDVPRSWEDLLNPKWKGKIAVNSELEIFCFQTPTWGEENIVPFLKKLGGQNPIFTKGVTKSMTLLGAGEYPIATDASLGVVIGLQKKGLPIAIAPISPLVSKFAPHVLVNDAPHPNAGKLYLRWLMSPEGQIMTDEVRLKGNPIPGSGTIQAKAIEKLGVKLLVAPAWEEDIKGIQKRYRKAIGFTKVDKK